MVQLKLGRLDVELVVPAGKSLRELSVGRAGRRVFRTKQGDSHSARPTDLCSLSSP